MTGHTIYHEETNNHEGHEGHKVFFVQENFRVLRVSSCLRDYPCPSEASSLLHHFCERITEPIEHPVAREKQDDRHPAEREQPPPVANRARKKQDLLIRDDEVRHRIEIQHAFTE